MAQSPNITELLEIYKTHAAAVDDVSRRREMANRMYLAATTTVAITMGIIGRFGTGEVPVWLVEAGMALVGMAIQWGWVGVIKSHRQLNEHKCMTLIDLEQHLPFAFYEKEYERMKKGEEPKVYFETTKAERLLPRVFMAAFTAVGATSVVWGIMKCIGT